MREVVEKDLGGKIADFFDEFDTKPLAAASIGQVHRARVKGTGERVVVKVQYPGVESVFRGDVRTIKTFCQVRKKPGVSMGFDGVSVHTSIA